MPKRSSRPDANEIAFRVVRESTAEPGDAAPAARPAKKKRKDPAAVALGRKGGLKGGKARAASLSKEERSDIAKRAAAARWATKKGNGEQ